MQKSKIIALIDISDFNNHFIETLLYANIYEKIHDHCVVFDLNNIQDNKYIDKNNRFKKEADLSTFKIFDRSLYQTLVDSSDKQNKALNLITSAKDKNQNLLVSLSQKENDLNKKVAEKIDEVIIFVSMKKDISNKLLKFLISNDIRNKKITLIIYGYIFNIDNEKELLSIRKMTKGSNISIETIDKINDFKTIHDIASIDPWDDIYKLLKKII